MKTVKLTFAERTALETCLNYDSREDQLTDNYSNAGIAEFREVLGWSAPQVAALIGSLEKKGLGFLDSEDSPDVAFDLSELGVNTIFDILEYEKLNAAPADPNQVETELQDSDYYI